MELIGKPQEFPLRLVGFPHRLVDVSWHITFVTRLLIFWGPSLGRFWDVNIDTVMIFHIIVYVDMHLPTTICRSYLLDLRYYW